MTELGSAPVPEPADDDHRRPPGSTAGGTAATRIVIVYADFECPFCAAVHLRLDRLPVSVVFRHFPVRSSHPRAWPAACAAEAAGLQGRFWEMHDSLFADQARLEDPHLWDRAQRLGLDVERFDADRRRDAVRERVQRDFRSGVRAGVVTTPTLFAWEEGAASPVAIGELEKWLGGSPGG
ncbi:MAG TPA: thioredoxin domain-containing protein [Solirubrobacteraceae bacterium]|nr:thioredoxin domain-containing protein [Solirubrobacteraceae bacterium]